MSRGALFVFLLVLGLLAGCAAIALEREPELGLDLRGGAQFVFEAQGTGHDRGHGRERRPDARGAARARRRARCRRVDAGPPGRRPDPGRAARRHRRGGGRRRPRSGSARPPSSPSTRSSRRSPRADQARASRTTWCSPTDRAAFIEVGPAALAGRRDHRRRRRAAAGRRRRGSSTSTSAARARTPSASSRPRPPVPRATPTGSPSCSTTSHLQPHRQRPLRRQHHRQTEISGDFTQAEAKELAALIEGGALPLPLESISDRLVGPTLGDAGDRRLVRGRHHRPDPDRLFITSSTGSSASWRRSRSRRTPCIAYAMLLALGATLTLPGLAGFVLAIGMAIDANVLVFERAREEYADAPEAGLRRR